MISVNFGRDSGENVPAESTSFPGGVVLILSAKSFRAHTGQVDELVG